MMGRMVASAAQAAGVVLALSAGAAWGQGVVTYA